MKKITLYLLLLLGGGCLFSSCNNWLDIKPATEMKKKDAFNSEQGFKDALTGVYIRLKSSALYGEQLAWGNIERLAQHWTTQGADDPYAVYNYRDISLEKDINTLFSELYGVIADANNILSEIDDKKEIFEEGYYELIKGEALGIRALCHLDILRLFGPIPGNETAGEILPYVKTVSLEEHPRFSYQQYTGLLEEDLDRAATLLATCDPILTYSISALNKPGSSNSEGFTPEDSFLAYRQIRMNYWAISGLKARFYLWTNRKELAYDYATKVIGAKDKSGNPVFRLGNGKDMAAPTLDYSLSCEHILAMHVYNLPTLANDYFKGIGTYIKNKNVITSQVFTQGTTDIRYTNLWTDIVLTSGFRVFTIKKYWQRESGSPCQTPLIRLSELYFIAMETAPSLSKASELYQEICVTRSISPVSITTPTQLDDLLVKEYRKEFYAEGQMFYTYKRRNSTNILGATTPASEKVYVLPLPLSEGR